MALELYVEQGGQRLRCGITTGTCAALAAGAATGLLLGRPQACARVMTPRGIEVEAEIQGAWRGERCAVCGVYKDGGDDIDATDGLLILARAAFSSKPGVSIEGGRGVGRVTRPGLDQPVGNAAINSVPRRMIAQAVEEACAQAGYAGGISVCIAVPEGKRVAQKTFNPHMGILGGISILGTSGIVEPRSLRALMDSIRAELRMHAAEGARRVLLTPGNYGQEFVQTGLPALRAPQVQFSNFIGETLDCVGSLGFEEALLVGHIGKLVKLAGGIMDTHSRVADCRTELFCAHAAVQGAGQEVCARLMQAATSDACLDILEEAGYLQPVLDSLQQRMEAVLERRVQGRFRIGLVVFSKQRGLLMCNAEAQRMIQNWGIEP